MERIFLFGVLLLPSFISLSCAQATGNSNDDLDYILTGMCTQSSGTIFQRMVYNQRIFSSWIQELRSVPKAEKVTRYFHPKPVDTPQSSFCQPMNTTCCKPNAEKHLTKVAKKEYSELFLNVTREGVGQCFTVGRYFYHAMYSTFTEIRRQLEIPLNNALDQKLNAYLFDDDFFSYLSHFSVNSDLCDLSYYLHSIMNDIFDFVHDGQQGDNLREPYPECYRNVSSQIMENVYEELFIRLERQLYNLDLIYRAMHISEEVLDSLKRHRFSSECTKPFTQLQNCAQCTGYFKFKPCLFYCINVFRGCFADVADIHREFRLLTNALSDIPDDILGTFQPEVFIRDSLIYFVHLAEDLQARNLKTDIAAACTDEEGAKQKRKSLHRRQSSSNIATVTPTTVTQEENRLMTAFNLELQCMKNIQSLLGRIPEMMCYQSREHDTIADSGNQRCWLGSRMGTYWHSQVRFTKEDQVDNPEFKGRPSPYLNQFDDLCIDIATTAAEINETLDLVLCVDDEDCLVAPYYICEPDEFEYLSGSGSDALLSSSGSGSGSGSNVDDGMRDMEDGDEEEEEDITTPSIDDIPQEDYRHDNNSTQFNDTTEEEEDDGGYIVWDIDGSLNSENITTTTIATTAISTTATYYSTSTFTPTPTPAIIDDLTGKPDIGIDDDDFTEKPDNELTSKPSPEINVTSSTTQLETTVTLLLLATMTFFCLLLA